MVDPVPVGAAAPAANHLQLVPPAPLTSGDATAALPRNLDTPKPREPARTRVHVEQSDGGAYVYRLVEAATGRVLAELPRTAENLLNGLHEAAAL
jgi:hypothetical protein